MTLVKIIGNCMSIRNIAAKSTFVTTEFIRLLNFCFIEQIIVAFMCTDITEAANFKSLNSHISRTTIYQLFCE
jgi:hypothetical protein